VTFVPVFYPGTPDVAAATWLTIGPGEEKTGIDFGVRLVPTARVEGVVVHPAGPVPANVEVRLVNVGRPAALELLLDILSILPLRLGPDGKFTFTGVAPGQYALRRRRRLPVGAAVLRRVAAEAAQAPARAETVSGPPRTSR
jgi:hypothetical protein